MTDNKIISLVNKSPKPDQFLLTQEQKDAIISSLETLIDGVNNDEIGAFAGVSVSPKGEYAGITFSGIVWQPEKMYYYATKLPEIIEDYTIFNNDEEDY